MKIYLDSEFKCHASDAVGMTAVETDFFDGKYEAFVEGYRFVPAGESWIRSDGEVLEGEMIQMMILLPQFILFMVQLH